MRSMTGGLLAALALVMVGAGEPKKEWSKPVTVITTHGRLAAANQVHVVGHEGKNLVHRSSADHGVTWGKPTVIAEAATNFPMMYGGIDAVGDRVFLLTGDGYVGGEVRQLDVRTSGDNGATWTKPVRITDGKNGLFRERIVASGDTLHVAGMGGPSPEASVLYFRSKDGGKTWDKMRVLADKLGAYGGGQTVAVDGKTVHIGYTKARNGVGAGDTYYIRSTDEGDTWSEPVLIGEKTEECDRQARVQLVAKQGHVFVCWQREAKQTGLRVPTMRLGYNTSSDGGKTWDGPKVLPGEGTDRNHQQVSMTDEGVVHLCWREGAVTETDAMGYMSSKNFGKDWDTAKSGFSTGKANHPYSISADAKAVHVLAGPLEEMVYSRLVK